MFGAGTGGDGAGFGSTGIETGGVTGSVFEAGTAGDDTGSVLEAGTGEDGAGFESTGVETSGDTG